MPDSQWGADSCELAIFAAGNATRNSANRALTAEEKLRALRLAAGYSWTKKALGKVTWRGLSMLAGKLQLDEE